MTYTPMENLKEFHSTFASNQSSDSLEDKIDRRSLFIAEEFEEVQDALQRLERTHFGYTSYSVEESLEHLAKELADLLYVVYGTADELNIPLEEVFQKVHQSNMGKVWPDGTVHRNGHGKVLKPPSYTIPDLSFIND